MISVSDAFKKFKARLELTQREQSDASRRQQEVRSVLNNSFSIDKDFLTGSYARHTKTKPLKDVDIFCVLSESESHHKEGASAALLEDFRKALADKYGEANVSTVRRSVQVSFGNSDDEEKVMSIDAVPAFAEGAHYLIPDPQTASDWTATDPTVHAAKATACNKAFNGEWVPLVKMLKKWNNFHDKPVKPSFLIEVMAIELFCPPFSGGYIYEIKGFLATAAQRITEAWADPAGLGPPVSDQMDALKCQGAVKKFAECSRSIDKAIQYERTGRNGDALKVWRDEVFGPMFPLS